MNNIQRAISLAVLIGGSILGAVAQTPPPAPPILKLTIASFTDGGQIPERHTCQGTGISPQVQWSNVPKGTASFVVVMHGTDNHPVKGIADEMFWVLWNVPGTATQLSEGLPAVSQLPDGSMQSKGSRDVIGYRAPCPPPGSGPHHYVFDLYAIDEKLSLTPQASREDVMKSIDGHILGATVYVGLFQR